MTSSSGDVLLSAKDLSVRFGGVLAVNKVSFDVRRGEVFTLIGPNGAGKTSFFNIVSGRLPASRGSLIFEGQDITRSGAHRRARLGMARSFQVTSLFGESSVLHNLQMAAMGVEPSRSYRFWSNWTRETQRLDVAMDVLRELELTRHAATPVAALAHGVQRVVEIGMCLAARPRLLLLDEPLAGLGLAEVPRITELLQRLKARYSVLLVEHNMRVVMGISDRITVMFQGNVIAEGPPAAIRENAQVRRVYLGSQS